MGWNDQNILQEEWSEKVSRIRGRNDGKYSGRGDSGSNGLYAGLFKEDSECSPASFLSQT